MPVGAPSRDATGLHPDFDGLTAPVIVACSGGPDSVALLVLTAEAGLEPVAVHIDHGLRADSADEAEVVAEVAERLGVSWRSVPVDVREGGNLEARARDARYAALRNAAGSLDATAILIAHTADDQAETVLLNLMRGAATTGLGGMAARRDEIARPLLHLRRQDVRALIAERSLPTIDDPTNAEIRWRRAWVRHVGLPTLNRGAQRDLVPVLARQADLAREESDLLDALGRQLLEAAGGADALQVRVLRDAPIALTRRALRSWLGVPPSSAAEVERVLAVVRGECVAAELAGGRSVRRSEGRLRISVRGAVP